MTVSLYLEETKKRSDKAKTPPKVQKKRYFYFYSVHLCVYIHKKIFCLFAFNIKAKDPKMKEEALHPNLEKYRTTIESIKHDFCRVIRDDSIPGVVHYYNTILGCGNDISKLEVERMSVNGQCSFTGLQVRKRQLYKIHIVCNGGEREFVCAEVWVLALSYWKDLVYFFLSVIRQTFTDPSYFKGDGAEYNR